MNKQQQPDQDSFPITFKQVDVGNAVVLDDKFLVQTNRLSRVEAQAQKQINDTSKQVEDMIKNAQERARKIIEEAKIKGNEEGKAARDAILKEGFDAGYQAGYQQASEEICDKLQASDAIVKKAYEVQGALIAKQQDMVCDLFEAVLTRIVGETFETKPGYILTVLSKAIEQLQLQGNVKVVLSAKTYSLLKGFSENTLAEFEKTHHISFEPDHNCQPFEMYLKNLDVAYDLSPLTQVDTLLKEVKPSIQIQPEPDNAS